MSKDIVKMGAGRMIQYETHITAERNISSILGEGNGKIIGIPTEQGLVGNVYVKKIC